MRLKRDGDGEYTTLDGRFTFQNPHKMDPTDPNRKWYVICDGSENLLGPFGTLRDAKDYVKVNIYQ